MNKRSKILHKKNIKEMAKLKIWIHVQCIKNDKYYTSVFAMMKRPHNFPQSVLNQNSQFITLFVNYIKQ